MKAVSSYDIVLAGRGGQGVIYLSRIMGQAALLQGLRIRTTETHGMAMRGGSVQCFVRVGEVHGPLFRKGSAALVMALHPGETSLALPHLREDGTVLISGGEGEKTGISLAGSQKLLALDADAIAVEQGNPRSANLALLGGAVGSVKGFPLEAWSIEAAIALMGPEKAVERNLEIFRKGLNSF